MPEGGVYRIDIRSSVGGNSDVHNIWHYEAVSIIDDLPVAEMDIFDLLFDGFSDNVLGPWLAIMSNDARLEQASITLPGGIFFKEYPLGSGYEGTVASESLPRFVTMSFKLQRATNNLRNGRKGIAGVPESWNNDSVFVGDVGAIGDFVEAISMLIVGTEGTATGSFKPVIARYNADHSAIVDKVDVVGANFTGFGSQNSRK